MFVTWKIWKALRYPLRWHPIFRRIRTKPKQAHPNRNFWSVIQIIVAIAMLAFIMRFPVPALITGLSLAIAIPVLLLSFNGTFLGLHWVVAISETLAQEYHDKRFDLLALTPYGALGVSWLIGTASIHRGDWLRLAYRILRRVLIIVLVLIGLASLLLIVSALSSNNIAMRDAQLRIFVDVLTITIWVLVLWLDHIQSIVIASLVGIVLPSYLSQLWSVRELARWVYLLLQMTVYLIIFAFYSLLYLLITTTSDDFLFRGFILGMITLVTFYLLREVIIGGLWRFVLWRFDTRPIDYQELF
jgi:hypothetical protein